MAPSGLSCSNPLSQEELTTLRWFPALNALPFHERLMILSKAKRGAVNWRRVNFGTRGLDRMETAAIQSLMANGFPMHGRGHFRHDPEDRLIVWLMGTCLGPMAWRAIRATMDWRLAQMAIAFQ